MPHWYAYLTIKHEEQPIIERIIRGFNNGALFGEFIPMPQDATDPDAWRMGHWGMMSDVGKGDSKANTLTILSPNEIRIELYTGWFLPIEFFDHLADIGCHVEASFEETTVGSILFYDNKTISQSESGYYRDLETIALIKMVLHDSVGAVSGE